MGYSVLLWNIPEKGLQDGDVVPVYIRSNISHVYVIGTSEGKFEVPLWQLTEPVSKSKVNKLKNRYADYSHKYATVALDGLPMRAEAVNTAKQVYRLRKNETVKLLYKVKGQAPMTGGKPLEGEWLKILTSDGTSGCCFSYNLRPFETDATGGRIGGEIQEEIENPNDEDCKVMPYAMLDIYDPGACIAVYNDKVYVFRTTNEIDIYSVEKDTRNGLKFSEKTTVKTGIPLENEDGKLFEKPKVMDFAVVPYKGGVRAVVCISQIFDNMFTPEDFIEGSKHEMYSLGSVSSFDLDESGNISNLKSNLGYNKSETGYIDYQNNNLSPAINYQINFIVSNSENVDGIPVIFGKTKILAIKEEEVILSDVGVYNDSSKKRLRRKSHLVKYDFKTLCDLDSDVNISFDINNISGSIGEWEEDIRN